MVSTATPPLALLLLLLILAHLVKDVVVEVATFAQLAANVQVALLLPSFDDAHAELAIWEGV